MVISDENKSAVFFELVSAKRATAVAWLSAEQKTGIKPGDELKILLGQQVISGKVKSVELNPGRENKYKLVAIFYYSQMVEPGKLLKIRL